MHVDGVTEQVRCTYYPPPPKKQQQQNNNNKGGSKPCMARMVLINFLYAALSGGTLLQSVMSQQYNYL